MLLPKHHITWLSSELNPLQIQTIKNHSNFKESYSPMIWFYEIKVKMN